MALPIAGYRWLRALPWRQQWRDGYTVVMAPSRLLEDEMQSVAWGLPSIMWALTVIRTGGRLRQAPVLEANLGYRARPCWVFMAQTHTLCFSLFPRSLILASNSLWMIGGATMPILCGAKEETMRDSMRARQALGLLSCTLHPALGLLSCTLHPPLLIFFLRQGVGVTR